MEIFWKCMCVCMCSFGGQKSALSLSLGAIHFIFWDSLTLGPEALLIQLDWMASELQGVTVSASSALGLQTPTPMVLRITNTLLTELSPQPRYLLPCLCLSDFDFWDNISLHSPGWPQSETLLPYLLECWNDGRVAPCWAERSSS